MKKILVVDDEKENAELVSLFLSHEGFDTDMAYSGNQAIEKINQDDFDLVISDIRMPDGDGVSILEELNRRGDAPPPVLMFITGYADISESEARNLGAKGFLNKPVDRKDLIEKVKETLGE